MENSQVIKQLVEHGLYRETKTTPESLSKISMDFYEVCCYVMWNVKLRNTLVKLICAHLPKSPPRTVILKDEFVNFSSALIAMVSHANQIGTRGSLVNKNNLVEGKEFILIVDVVRASDLLELERYDTRVVKKLIAVFDRESELEEQFRSKYPHVKFVTLLKESEIKKFVRNSKL